MIPRILLGTALIPDTDKEMQLYQSGDLFSIKIPGRGDLMNSRVHGSEKALADLACEKLGETAAADRWAWDGIYFGSGLKGGRPRC
jgi:spermidine synthase